MEYCECGVWSSPSAHHESCLVCFKRTKTIYEKHYELERKLELANVIIDELVEVAQVHLDDTFEKIKKLRAR